VQLPYRHFERTPSGVIAERLRQLDVLRGFFTGQMPVLAIDLLFVVCSWALPSPSAFTWRHCGRRDPCTDRRLAGDPIAPSGVWPMRISRRWAAKSSTLGETVANAATIKALGLEAEVEKRWQARAEQAAWTNFRASHLANVPPARRASCNSWPCSG